jgi:hypothetical protein
LGVVGPIVEKWTRLGYNEEGFARFEGKHRSVVGVKREFCGCNAKPDVSGWDLKELY